MFFSHNKSTNGTFRHDFSANLDELLLLQHGLGNSLAFRRDADKGKMEQSADDAYPITLSFAGTDNSNEDYIVGRDNKDRQGWEAWVTVGRGFD